MRPEGKSLMSHMMGGVLESLGDFQESGTDAGLDHMDALVDASRSALSMVEGQQPGEFPQEAKEALGRVVQIIKDTMIPTLVDLHTEDQKLVDIVHQEVADCNDGMTKRLQGDTGQNKEEAEKLRDEEADLAQQVADLQSQNISKHEELAALMSNRQPPSLCSSFPDLPVEDLWEAYYRRVEEYSAAAAAEAKNLQDRRNERDSIVSSLVSTTERHVSTAAALSVSFCDWSRNLQAACSAHDECYADTSDRMQAQLESFRDARDKRIAAYRAALKLIDNLLTVMHENKPPMPDDAETRFPPSGKEVPEKAECDLGVLDEWDASIYACDAKDSPCVAPSYVGDDVQWTYIWSYRGNAHSGPVSVWRPHREGYCSLGDIVIKQGVTVIPANIAASFATLATGRAPLDFAWRVAENQAGGINYWEPICETGYISLGHVGVQKPETTRNVKPPSESVCCVPESLGVKYRGSAGVQERIWSDPGTGGMDNSEHLRKGLETFIADGSNCAGRFSPPCTDYYAGPVPDC